jgi:hypothetical protein
MSVKKINFDISNSEQLKTISDKLDKAYSENDSVIFCFNITNLTVNNTNNLGTVLSLVKKYKSQEHKLKNIDIICPKNHTIKREIVKKCIKSIKINKPIYLVS